jgi:hypothetical protein
MATAGLPQVARQIYCEKRILREIHEELLYRQFIRECSLAEVSPYAFTDMLNCSPDASADVIALKFRRMFTTAEVAGDDEALSFLRACAERFANLMPNWDKRER